jgi:hypothetical protein
VAVSLGAAQKTAPLPKTESPVIESDDGELTWDTTARRMLIRTRRSVGVVGTMHAGETIALDAVKIVPGATMQDWATITLTVMDGADFTSARKILLTATGYAGNADMRWKDAEKTSVGRDWGNGPSVVEGIPATITLPLSSKAKAWALDARGQRAGEVPLKVAAGKVTIEIGPPSQTLWYEIAVGQ